MDFGSSRSTVGRRTSTASLLQEERYKMCSMYTVPPEVAMTVENFAEFGADRLDLLKKIEALDIRGKAEGEEAAKEIWELCDRYLKVKEGGAGQAAEGSSEYDPLFPRHYTSEMKDQLSHFVLRIVHCGSADLRKWFTKYEVLLFRHKFRALESKDQVRWLCENDLMGDTCRPVTSAEWQQHREGIRLAHAATSFKNKNATLRSENFFKVRWQKVPDLVATRQVYMRAGWAFVPRAKLVRMVSIAFRLQLSRGLAIAQSRRFVIESEKDRLGGIMSALAKRSLGFQNVGTDAKTSKQVIDTFLTYLKKNGYSDPKLKENVRNPGSDKHFLIVGYRKPNEKDRTCPFAGRVHKSNTQRFTVHVSTKVMVQRCWDSTCDGCQHYFQIQNGGIKAFGAELPPAPKDPVLMPPPKTKAQSGSLKAGLKGGDCGSSKVPGFEPLPAPENVSSQ